jgi:hypothetical protein
VEIKIDLAGALLKTAALAKTPQAARKCLQRWGSETVLVLKRSAAGMKGSGRKTGQLARSVGMKMAGNVLTVGTNVQKQTDVKYAKIQDEGGDIVPRTKKFLTIPFPGVKGKATDYKGKSFFMKTKSGALILAMLTFGKSKGSSFLGGGGIKPLFLLTKWVRIKPSHWFSRPMFEQMPALNQYMDPDFVYDVAANMAGVAGGGEA